MKTIYTLPAPDSLGAMIEVYGEPENAWYEWRIIDGGRTVRDTGTEGHSAFQGRQYGQAEIALRDALISLLACPSTATRRPMPPVWKRAMPPRRRQKRRGRVREHPAAPNHNRSTKENSMALDIMAAFTNEPPELDFIWPGFLAGTVGALAHMAPKRTTKTARSVLGLTMADPAGIGPEVIAKALADRALMRLCTPVVVGSRHVMERTIAWLKLLCRWWTSIRRTASG